MKKSYLSKRLLSCVLGLLLTCASGGQWQAQEFSWQSVQAQQKTRKTPAIRAKIFDKLTKAQEAAEEGNIAKGLEILNALKKRADSLNSYERAQMWNFYAYIYFSQDNYKKALSSYSKVLKEENIPLAMEQSTYYAMAQLYFQVEDYRRAAENMEAWFKMSETPSPNAYILLGQAYFQLKKYKQAERPIQKAIDLYKGKGKKPKENWYLLQRVIYYEQRRYDDVRRVLETLVRLYPKKEYWTQLSSMYGELKREKDQLAALDAIYVQGKLNNQAELLNLAYLYIGQDVPYKGAKILQKALDKGQVKKTARNYRTLASAWRQAQEVDKAILAMEKAARLSDQGELFVRLGNLYLDGDNYDQAIKALNQGLNKGGVKRSDQAYVALGLAYFNVDKLNSSLKAFRSAQKDKRSRKMAGQWERHILSEQARRKKLEEGRIR